jgi:hypothetical protein
LHEVKHLILGARSGKGLISYRRYLGQVFWPTDLSVFCPRRGRWSLEQVLLAGGGVIPGHFRADRCVAAAIPPFWPVQMTLVTAPRLGC